MRAECSSSRCWPRSCRPRCRTSSPWSASTSGVPDRASRLLCGPSPAAAGSAVAGTEAAVRVFSGLERSCRSQYPALLPTVTTTTSARDMDRLRAALGVQRIDFYGLSYGTALGSVYRQLFPGHVRSMVLDGAVDANLSLSTDATAEAPAIENGARPRVDRVRGLSRLPAGNRSGGLLRGPAATAVHRPVPAAGGGDSHAGDRGGPGHGHAALPLRCRASRRASSPR